MQRLQKIITWTVLTSELSHVFCCVLPTVVSILTLLSGMGVLTVMPTSLLFLHDMIHAWEIPMIVTSGFLLFAGWGLYFLSLKLDCADTGCAHPPCTPA